MTLSLRQMAAYLEFCERLDRIDHANDILATAYGAQCDSKTIEKITRELHGRPYSPGNTTDKTSNR